MVLDPHMVSTYRDHALIVKAQFQVVGWNLNYNSRVRFFLYIHSFCIFGHRHFLACYWTLASSPGHSQILSCSRLRDKIWEWPGDEANWTSHGEWFQFPYPRHITDLMVPLTYQTSWVSTCTHNEVTLIISGHHEMSQVVATNVCYLGRLHNR